MLSGLSDRWARNPLLTHEMKRVLRKLVKGLAVVAGLVFLFFNPLANDVGLWFFASIPVLLLCFVLLQVLENDEDSSESPDK